MNKIVNSLVLSTIASSLLIAGGDIAPVEPVIPEVVVSDSWNYSASIYLWGSGIGGTTEDGQKVNISFSDVVKKLDFGFMGNVAAHKGKWTFGSDVLYLKVGDSISTPIPFTRFELKDWVVTPYAAYNIVESDQWNVDLLAGARYLYMKPQITTLLGVASGPDSIWDGIIGIKGDYKLNEKWFMPFTFDVGGGDSDITYQALAGVGYKYENFDLIAGYRYLKWEFDGALAGFTELDISGPIIGAKFRF